MLDTLQPGDLLGFRLNGWLGQGINIATGGIFHPLGLSHVARVAKLPTRLNLVLFESTMLAPQPCLLRQREVKGVQCQVIANRIKEYDGEVWHFPLFQPLNDYETIRLTTWWEQQLGKSYDLPGAIRSRRRFWARKEDLTSLFCSEACAADLRIVNRTIGDNASGWSPNSLRKASLKQCIYFYPRRIK